MNKQVLHEAIEFLRDNLTEKQKSLIKALHSTSNWWDVEEWKMIGLTIRNSLREKNYGELFLEIPDLEKPTKSGMPFYILMIEKALFHKNQ